MTNETNQDYVYALAASSNFSEDGILFAAKRSGLFRSTDRGQTWQPAYGSLGVDQPLPTTYVATSPEFTHDHTVFAAVGGNILRSTDGGENWQYAELGKPAPIVSTLATSTRFAEDGLVLAATLEDGIFRSTSQESQWTGWNFGLLDSTIYALLFSGDGCIYAGAESGIFYSTTGGRSWLEVDFPVEMAPVFCLASIQKHLYAGTEENGLFKSKDGGRSWEQLSVSGTIEQILAEESSGILVVQGDALLFSKDGGETWERRAGSEVGSPISCVTAPLGLGPGAPLWVGLSNGEVVRAN